MSPTDDRPDASLILRSFIHELRQPLVGLKGAYELIGSSLARDVTASPDWKLAGSQLARIEELAATYDEIFRADELQQAPLIVGDVVQYVVELSRYRLRRLGERFTVEVKDELPLVYGSKLALVHALSNLLKNAVDATAAQGDGARIGLLATASGDGVEIRVCDDGPGVPEAIREQIFAADFTTKSKGKGSGLGLFIARRLLERAGAQLALSEEPGCEGAPWATTTFVIRLPREPRNERPAAPAVVAASDASETHERRSALVVDDEAVVQVVMDRLLTPAGFDITYAATGPEAIERLDAGPFDLLITDKNLPGCDGVAVVRAARERYSDLPIIMVTGFPSLDSATALMPLAIDAYVKKPFDPDELLATIQRVLHDRREKRAPPATGAQEVLLVEQPGAARDRLESDLAAEGFRVHALRDVRAALANHPEAPVALVADGLCDAAARLAIYARRELDTPFSLGLIVDASRLSSTIAATSLGARALLPRSELTDAAQLRAHMGALCEPAGAKPNPKDEK